MWYYYTLKWYYLQIRYFLLHYEASAENKKKTKFVFLATFRIHIRLIRVEF